ncbi:MFS transporter [bacterium]|nr:MFS transporter [bacterium]
MASEPAPAPIAQGPRWLGFRLSLMCFLQWTTWGVWIPVLGKILKAPVAEGGLGFSELQFGLLMGVPATLGAIAAPFLAGQLADRYFSVERLLGAFELTTCVLLWVMASQTSFAVWMVLLIVSSVVRAPTLALANALAFTHLSDARTRFPRVRVWGTVGWIVAGWGFSAIWLKSGVHLKWLPPFLDAQQVPDVTARLLDAIRAGALLSLIYGLYCFTLPHTPPRREGVDPLAFRKAFRLFRQRPFVVLMITWLLIACVHNIYFMHASRFLPQMGLRQADILPAMSVGQFAEIIVMVFLGFFLKRLGTRRVLLVGAFAYVLRFAAFGTTSLPLGVIVASQALHGVCFACFYATGFIYVDQLADADVRTSAQTLIGLVLGLAPLFAGLLSAQLAALCTPAGGQLNYAPFWYALGGIAFVATAFLALCLPDDTDEPAPAG